MNAEGRRRVETVLVVRPKTELSLWKPQLVRGKGVAN